MPSGGVMPIQRHVDEGVLRVLRARLRQRDVGLPDAHAQIMALHDEFAHQVQRAEAQAVGVGGAEQSLDDAGGVLRTGNEFVDWNGRELDGVPSSEQLIAQRQAAAAFDRQQKVLRIGEGLHAGEAKADLGAEFAAEIGADLGQVRRVVGLEPDLAFKGVAGPDVVCLEGEDELGAGVEGVRHGIGAQVPALLEQERIGDERNPSRIQIQRRVACRPVESDGNLPPDHGSIGGVKGAVHSPCSEKH